MVITSLCFQSGYHDSSLFVKCTSAGRIYLSFYADTIIITDDDHDGTLKHDLAFCFAMKDLGLLCYLLRIEVPQSPKVIFYLERSIS